MAPKKKTRNWQTRVEEDLDEQAKKYAADNKISLGALIRTLMKFWTDPEDPRPLPPGIEKERKRPPRKKK